MNKTIESNFIFRIFSRIFFEDQPVEYPKKPIGFCYQNPHPPVEDYTMCPWCGGAINKK